MFTSIVAIAVLAMTYGLFWHNQPARQRSPAAADDNNRKEDLRAVLGPQRNRVPASTLALPPGQGARGESGSTPSDGATVKVTAQTQDKTKSANLLAK